jgi:hypothetical protein
MSKNHGAISMVSGYGIKPVQVDGVTVATVLKFAVKKNSLLHRAYWAAFGMHDFGTRPKLYLQEQDVCKNKSNIRLYCLAKSGQDSELMGIYRQAQILVREAEIAEFKNQDMPAWYYMFWDAKYPNQFGLDQASLDDLPF